MIYASDEIKETFMQWYKVEFPEGYSLRKDVEETFQLLLYKTFLAGMNANESDKDHIIRVAVSQMMDSAGVIEEYLAMPCGSLEDRLRTTSQRLQHTAKQIKEELENPNHEV